MTARTRLISETAKHFVENSQWYPTKQDVWDVAKLKSQRVNGTGQYFASIVTKPKARTRFTEEVRTEILERRPQLTPTLKANPRPVSEPAPYLVDSSAVIEGCLVEVKDDRHYIYFTADPKPYDSHIKIWKGTHIGVEGNVTILNIEGFKRALVLAERVIKTGSAQLDLNRTIS